MPLLTLLMSAQILHFSSSCSLDWAQEVSERAVSRRPGEPSISEVDGLSVVAADSAARHTLIVAIMWDI